MHQALNREKVLPISEEIVEKSGESGKSDEIQGNGQSPPTKVEEIEFETSAPKSDEGESKDYTRDDCEGREGSESGSSNTGDEKIVRFIKKAIKNKKGMNKTKRNVEETQVF